MLKDLFKGSVVYGVAPFVPKILTVLLLPVLTKYLTSTDYGIIGTITSILFAVQALQDLGLRSILPNYFYKCRSQYKVVWREIYGFLSIWMVIFAIIQAVLLFFFIPEEAEPNKWLIIILSNFSTVFFGPTAMIGQMYYQLNLKPIPVAFRIILAGVVTIMVNYLCVVILRWGYMGAYVGSFAGVFLSNLTYWPVVCYKLGLSPIYNFKKQTVLRLLKISMPTIPHYYCGYLMNSSNVVAMNVYGKPQSEIGYLTMAQTVSNMFESILNAVNQVVSPMSYAFIRDKNSSEMKRIFFSYILFSYAITFIYCLWSREIYSLLISNDEISATYRYSIIFVMALNYRPVYVYCINYFFYFENTIKMLGITFTAGLLSFLFYFIFTPVLGIFAPLLGFYLGCLYLGYSGYLFKFYKRHTVYRVNWKLLLITQLLLTTVVFYLVDLCITIKIIISIIYIVILLILFSLIVLQKIKVGRVF